MSSTSAQRRTSKVHPADRDLPSRSPSPPPYAGPAQPTTTTASSKTSLLLSARSFLAYSHHKLLSTLEGAPMNRCTGRARDTGHVLRRAVVIQNAMDEVEVFVQAVLATPEAVPARQPPATTVKAPLPRRASERDVRRLFGIAEEDEEDEEHLGTTSTSSSSGETDWFEQTWSTLDHSDYSDAADSGEERFADHAAVQVVAVGDDDELELDIEDYRQPEVYDARAEIYLAMPPSPALRPTVIADKMEGARYTAPPPPSPPVIAPAPVPVFSDEEDMDACPDAASDCGSEDDTEDDSLPVTPTQDLVDDFGAASLAAKAEHHDREITYNTKIDTGVSHHDDDEDFEGERGECRDCPGCMGEGFSVRDDEVIF